MVRAAQHSVQLGASAAWSRRPLRILFASNRYPPHILGGYELSCQLAVEGLRARGHTVKVLASDFRTSSDDEADTRVARVLHRPSASTNALDWARWHVADARTSRRILQEFKPDLISVWNLLDTFPAALQPLVQTGLPVVYHLHDLWLLPYLEFANRWSSFWGSAPSSVIRRIAKDVVRFAVARSAVAVDWPCSFSDFDPSYAVFCSDFARSSHGEAGLAFNESVVILNGVRADRIVAARPGSAGPIQVLYVGRICHAKGLHTLVEALSMVDASYQKQVFVTVVGPREPSDEYFRSVADRVAAAGLRDRVRFAGPIAHERMPAIYAEHDVLVLPSFREGLPRVVLEAQAAGLAVVTTPAGGTAQIVTNGEDALTFSPGDAPTLAGLLTRLVEDRPLGKRLALAGQRRVAKSHDVENTIDAIEAFYCNVSATKSQSRHPSS
jgi:glycogen(starch) synthase